MKKWESKENKDKILFQGKRRPRSGGIWAIPGDVITKTFLIDCKTTINNSFSITEKIWNKIYYEALKCRKLPCLSIELGNKTEIIVIDNNDYLAFFKDETFRKKIITNEDKNFSITESMWKEVKIEAFSNEKLPCLLTQLDQQEIILLDKDDFYRFLISRKDL